MGSPDINPQLEEFERSNQFRVELPNPKGLYKTFDHQYHIKQGAYKSQFLIGALHSQDSLFSEINVEVIVQDRSGYHGSYFVRVGLQHPDPNYQYWTNDQTERLKEVMTRKYGYRSSSHHMLLNQHNLTIKDPQLKYDLRLGYEDEETAFTNQRQALQAILQRENVKDEKEVFPFRMPKEVIEWKLKTLVNDRHSIDRPSSIRITLIGDKPDNSRLFPTTRAELAENPRNPKFRDFIGTTQKWTKFIGDAVNAMGKVKGIPQSGKLTLLPPSEPV